MMQTMGNLVSQGMVKRDTKNKARKKKKKMLEILKQNKLK